MINTVKLSEYKKYVRKYMQERLHRKFDSDSLMEICGGINSILLDWTGNTYVGRKKEPKVERAYQDFFELIRDFLVFCSQNEDILDEMEKSLAEFMIYRGTVYRYLGIADSRNYRKKKRVDPVYNNVYVSWSRSEKNSYIESKLCGPRTWMKAEIREPEFGIDIHGFELWCEKWIEDSSFITRGEEKEVVFPTVEKCIVEIKTL